MVQSLGEHVLARWFGLTAVVRHTAILVGVLAVTLMVVVWPPPARAAATSDTSGSFTAVTSTRVLDTRSGLGGRKGAVPPHGTVLVPVSGVSGAVPAGVGAVLINVTVTHSVAPGYVTAFAAGSSRPPTSNENFGAGKTVSACSLVQVDSLGRVALFLGSSGSAELVVDVEGYLSPGVPTDGTSSVSPTRVLDTRQTGVPLAAGGSRVVSLAGRAGIPRNATAAVVNLTVTGPGAAGYVTAFPTGSARPGTSNVNFAAGQTIANLVFVRLGSGGDITLYNGSGRAAQLIVDVQGYGTGNSTVVGRLDTQAPRRLLDTRSTGPVGADKAIPLLVAGAGGVPTHGVAAAVVNITAVGGRSVGYISAYPSGTPRPLSSTVSYPVGGTVADVAVVPVGADGRIVLFNGSSASANVIVDVEGYVVGSATGLDATAFQESAVHDGVAPGAALSSTPQKLWSRDFGDDAAPHGLIGYPIIAGGRLFVTTANQTTGGSSLWAFDARSGVALWGPTDLGGYGSLGGLTFDNGRIFAVNDLGVVRAFDPVDGLMEWSMQLPQLASYSPPTAVGGVLYATDTGVDGDLFAINESTGAIKWHQLVDSGQSSAPAADATGVYYADSCEKAAKFSLAGAAIWTYGGFCQSAGGGRTPALHDGKLWLRDDVNDTPEVLDAATGRLVGHYDSYLSPPVFGNGLRFELPGSSALTAVNDSTGAQVWSETKPGELLTSPIISGSIVYCASGSGTIYGFSASTGAVMWQADTGSSIYRSDEHNQVELAGNTVGDGILAVAGVSRLTVYG